MASLQLKQLVKQFGDTKVIHGVDLKVADGEFVVFVGPSGCGKSTLLRLICGLEEVSSGDLLLDGQRVNHLPAADRGLAMVFQSYALYPHLTVRDNIAFALKLRKMPKDEINRRVNDTARILELEENLDRRPGQLSGGQRQRVAMGRAIVRQPQVFLMDEPLSNLDAKLRVQMRAEISRLQHSLNVTTVYVTHDQIEAMTMGHRVAVMSKGYLQQVATPQHLYDFPDNLFVAAFIGSPQMNLLRGTYTAGQGGGRLTMGSQSLNVPESVLAARPTLAGHDGKEVAVGIRPEHLEDAALAPGSELLTGTTEVREGLGSEVILHVRTDAPSINTAALGADAEHAAQVILARVDPATTLHPGDKATLSVDTRRLHLFDLDSGLAIR